MRNWRNPIGVFLLSLVLLLGVSASATAGRPQQNAKRPEGESLPSIPPQELVRRVIDNELKAGNDDDLHYMYKDRRQTPAGSKTKLMVETTQGTVAYLVATNDQRLNQQQRTAEEQRLQKLLSSPAEQQKKRKEQQADSDRVTKMFRELPNAFDYKYEGVVPGNNGDPWVEMSFSPNPNYDPPSRETSVFKAMAGGMVVDPVANRLVRIEARLFRDVNFGWGILGHLNSGGHFIVEQSEIGPSRWEPTYMNIQFAGKALLFKTIDLRQIETTSDYVRVPDNLTLAQGVDMLKKRFESELAENSSKGK